MINVFIACESLVNINHLLILVDNYEFCIIATMTQYNYTSKVGSQVSPLTSSSLHPSLRPNRPAFNPSSNASNRSISSRVNVKPEPESQPTNEFSAMAFRSSLEPVPDRGRLTYPLCKAHRINICCLVTFFSLAMAATVVHPSCGPETYYYFLL